MSGMPIDLTDSLKNLPKILYRGDQAARICRTTGHSVMVDKYQQQGLYTNLICNGNPLAVSRMGIRSSVAQHVNGWSLSHYLSFSTDIRVAELFATGLTSKRLSATNNPKWDAVIFSFDVMQIQWQLQSVGVYYGVQQFNGLPPYFGGVTSMALIDCVTLLSSLVSAGQAQYSSELKLARMDKEWLIIPLDPLPPGTNSHVGYSAELRSHLISGTHYDLI